MTTYISFQGGNGGAGGGGGSGSASPALSPGTHTGSEKNNNRGMGSTLLIHRGESDDLICGISL